MLRSDKFRRGRRFELDKRNAATVMVGSGVALRLPLQLFLVVVVMVTAPRQSHALDLSQCRTALGMQSGEIPDTAITASSSFDPLSVGPASARIRTELHGGAWCPKEQVSKDTHEYLQIEFNHLTVITLVETQGRFGNGQGQEYMEQYKLEYQREDDGRWFKFRNRRQQEILQGNINTYIPELRDVEPPIIGRRIRFVPYSAHSRPVCVRVELYGCQWTDGVVSYSMPQGDRRKDIDLFDMTYDGDVIQPTPFSAESAGNVESSEVGAFVTRVRLSGGLGQLTDGDEGQSNFRLDPRVTGLKGFEWVGWRNDSFAVDSPGVAPIEIVWKFDATRNFSSVRIHCNNMFTKDVRVFRAVRVWFSIGGSVFSSPPVYYRYVRDSITEFGRSVIIQLNHGIGRYVKIQLEFDSRWMLVSEFQFQSVYVTEDVPVEVDPSVLVSTTPVPIGLVKDHDDVTGNSIEPSIVNNAVVDGRQIPKVSTVAPPRDGDPNQPEVVPPVTPSTPRFTDEYIGIIVGVLISAFLFVVVIIIILVIRRRRRTCRRKYDSGSSYTGRGTYENGAVKCSADLPQRRLPSIDRQPWNSGKLAIVNGGSCETDGLSGPYGDGLIAGAANEAGVSSDIDSDTTGTGTCCGLGVAGTCRSPGGDEDGCGRRGPVHVEFYRVPTEKDRERRYSDKLPKLPQTPDSLETYTSSRDYAMPSFNVSSQPQFIAGLVPSETPVNHHNSTSLSTTATVITLPLVVGPGANGSSIGGGASTLQRRPCPPPPPPSYASAASSSTNTGYYQQHLKTAPRRHHQGHQDSPYGFVGGLTTGGSRAGAGAGTALTLGGAPVTGNGQPQAPASSAFQTASTIGRPPVETTVNVVEFPRENLRFVEKIGDGTYGEIHLCEAFHLVDYVPHVIGVSSRSVVVLVKTLRRNASELTRTDFERDLRVTSRTNDVNVVRLLGACLQGANETRCLILEFPRHGDLAQFLRHHSSPDDVMSATNGRCQQQRPKTGPILEYGTLVYMASQIASGMKHLESLHIVHRDIAARNCLVGDLYQVKVSDLGPGRDLYADDYSQDAIGSPLPVRWMSWEAALLGQLSTKSDVWSFGITLWEVLTYARARPLAALNDRQVFDNLERIRNSSSSSSEETISPSALPVPSATAADCIDDDDSDDDDRDVIGSSSGGPILLPGRPAGCPRETYDLMRECWRRDPDRRPTFRETHMFLQRLNVGYSPPPTVNNSGTINGTTGSVNNRQVPNRGSVGTMGYQRAGSRTALA